MRPSPLTLWHLLSLDAPTVAALWTWFVAHCCAVALPFSSIAAMSLAVWILYVSDRLLDARGNTTALEERHHFHHRHRRIFIAFIVAAAIALAMLTPGLSPTALRIYALLAALLTGWFLVIHTRLAHERRLPKELAVGLFFSAAIFIPTIARRPDLRLSLLAPAFVFAAVCALNCMYLYIWEHPSDRTNANWTTRVATHHLSLAAVIILIAAFGGIVLPVFPALASKLLLPVAPSTWPIAAACVLSTLLLVILNRSRAKLSPLNIRAAADFALRHADPLPANPMNSAPNFDRVARIYRWAEYLTLGPLLQRIRSHFLPQLADRRRALVLGDGDGRFLARLLAQNPALQATAVDTSDQMLTLLRARCGPTRVQTIRANALTISPPPGTDLIVTHFFLDCFTQEEINALALRLAEPETLWLLSDFRASGPLSRAYVRSFYLAFRMLTGLRVTQLPDPAAALCAAGFRRIAQHQSIRGLLYTELWQRSGLSS